MANVFFDLPTIAGNGPGTSVDVSSMGALKTVTVAKTGDVFQPFVLIEIACDAAGAVWNPLKVFQSAGQQSFAIACLWMRATVMNYKGGAAPNCDVAGDDAGTTAVNLPTTASTGTGAPVDVSALENFKTISVGGTFRGAVNVEISGDGVDYETVASFSAGRSFSSDFAAQWMRVVRSGVPGVAPGTVHVNVAATAGGGGGGGGGALIVEDEGIAVPNGPFTTMNFTGAGVTATDAGAGTVDVDIPGATVGPGTINTLAIFTAVDEVGDSSVFQDADANVLTNNRVTITGDLNDPGEDPILKVVTNGTNVGHPPGHALDGGIQSFNTASYDTTGGQRQSFAGLFHNDSSVASGVGGLVVTGVSSRATGGTENYSFFGLAGTMRNNEDATIGTILTVGAGAAIVGATTLYTAFIMGDNTKEVLLGNNVDSFVVPGSAAANPSISIGHTSGATARQLATKNTNTTPGATFGGVEVYLDTTVQAGARGGLTIYRGAGGGAELAGFDVAGSVDSFAIGTVANDLCVWLIDTAATGKRLTFATGAGPTVRAYFETGGRFVTVGDALVGANLTANNGLTTIYQTIVQGYLARQSAVTPAALALGTTNDYAIGGLSGNGRIRQATNVAGSALSGIVPIGVSGAEWTLLNLGPGTLTLLNADGGSAAANQFVCEGGVNRVLGVNGAVIIAYDATLARWIVIG